MQEGVLSLIRREIRREEGLLIDVEDLAAAIQKMLSAEAREQIGPMKIRKKRSAAKRRNEVRDLRVDGTVAEGNTSLPSPTTDAASAATEHASDVFSAPEAKA